MRIPLLRAVFPLIIGHVLLNKWCLTPSDETSDPLANALRERMWPILLVFVGLAWESSRGGRQVDFAFVVLLATICLWFWLWCQGHVNQAKMVLILIAITSGVTVWLSAKASPKASLLLMPLMAWLLFAERLELPKIKIKLPKIKLPKFTPGNVSVE